jgi:hypothetical protein
MTLDEMMVMFPLGSKVVVDFDERIVIGYNPRMESVLCAYASDYCGKHNLITWFDQFVKVKEGLDIANIPIDRHAGHFHINRLTMLDRRVERKWVEI